MEVPSEKTRLDGRISAKKVSNCSSPRLLPPAVVVVVEVVRSGAIPVVPGIVVVVVVPGVVAVVADTTEEWGGCPTVNASKLSS